MEKLKNEWLEVMKSHVTGDRYGLLPSEAAEIVAAKYGINGQHVLMALAPDAHWGMKEERDELMRQLDARFEFSGRERIPNMDPVVTYELRHPIKEIEMKITDYGLDGPDSRPKMTGHNSRNSGSRPVPGGGARERERRLRRMNK